MAKHVNKIERVVEGSGNVLVDLGLSDAAELCSRRRDSLITSKSSAAEKVALFP
jgi:hypothetical protein